MRVIEEIRRLRLLQLKAKFGSFAAINEALGRLRTDATLNQIANQAKGSKTGQPKAMGSPLARLLEEKLKLGDGWMDNDPDLVAAASRPWPLPGIAPGDLALLNEDEIRPALDVLAAAIARRQSGEILPTAVNQN